MIVNSFIIYCLLNFYLLAGNFFLKFSGPKSLFRNAMLSEKIIAGIFFINFFFLIINFFLPTKSLFVLIIFLLFCLFILFKYFFLIKKNFNFFLIVSIAFSPLSIYMNPGYDGGLYHLPFQKVLQDQNIHFGLSNVHNRYGLTGITNYFNSFLWNKDFANILSSNQTILFLTFFLIIKDNIKLNIGYLNVYIICAIFTFPLWYRYAPLQYGTVDIIFSIFIFIHFLYLSKLIFKNYEKHKDFAEIFYIFCMCTTFTFAVKPTGSILIINIIIVFLFLYKKIYNSFKNFFFENFIFIIFFIIWIIRNLIISGCFIYPVVLTCFNFDWFDLKSTLNINTSIIFWNNQYSSLLVNNLLKIYHNYIILFLSFFLFLLISYKFFYIYFLYFYRKYKNLLFSILVILFIILSLRLTELKNLEYLFKKDKQSIETFLIIKNEFLNILLFYAISFCILFLNFYRNVQLFKKKNDSKFFLPLIFFTILFCFWILNAPHPRLGQFLLLLFIPSIVFIFVQYQNIQFSKFSINFIYISIFFLIINLSILTNIKKIQYNDIFFYQIRIPETSVSKRSNFGYRLTNPEEDQCWVEPNCYPYEDTLIYKKFIYYNFYKKN